MSAEETASSVETVSARDGTPLLTRAWPVAGKAWGTVLVVHGLGEHSGRHDATGGRFAAAGLVATAFDHRGFGASGGRRAYVDRWADFLDDIEDRFAAGRVSGLPAAIYGHSLGGLLVAEYLLDGRPLPDAAVLSAPGLAGGNALLRALARGLARAWPTFALANPWSVRKLARDPRPRVVAERDPLSVKRTTARLGHHLFEAMARVNSRLVEQGGFPVPTLVVHGGDDTLVPTASTAFLERFPTTERRVYPGVRHEPHHDPLEGAAIVGEMIDWLRQVMPGSPGASGARAAVAVGGSGARPIDDPKA
jgi:alpha-beta hydrolase superfamily lysophospholipase